MIGFIYVMSNPAHPGLVKIGQTSKDPDIRRNDLNSTGVLEDFILEYRVLASDYLKLEKEIHLSQLPPSMHSNCNIASGLICTLWDSDASSGAPQKAKHGLWLEKHYKCRTEPTQDNPQHLWCHPPGRF